MSETDEPVQPEYILVALDASPHSAAALAAAAELAAALHLELRGLFVEDVSLLHLCGLPFGLEFGSFTARPRRLEQTHVEREFRIQATRLRKIMADVAGKRRIAWSFQVVRGAVTDQLLAAGATARLLSLGRVGRSPGKRLGSTAQAVAANTRRPVVIQAANQGLTGPFTVVFTGSSAAHNALSLAAELSGRDESILHVLVAGEASLEEGVLPGQPEEQAVAMRHLPDPRQLLAELRSLTRGTVILPAEVATWLDEIAVTVLVVP